MLPRQLDVNKLIEISYSRYSRLRKEVTALEPLHLWTSSIVEVFYIEQRLCAATVGHVGQSWAEATEHSNFTRDEMDLQHRLYSPAVLSRQHLEFY